MWSLLDVPSGIQTKTDTEVCAYRVIIDLKNDCLMVWSSVWTLLCRYSYKEKKTSLEAVIHGQIKHRKHFPFLGPSIIVIYQYNLCRMKGSFPFSIIKSQKVKHFWHSHLRSISLLMPPLQISCLESCHYSNRPKMLTNMELGMVQRARHWGAITSQAVSSLQSLL